MVPPSLEASESQLTGGMGPMSTLRIFMLVTAKLERSMMLLASPSTRIEIASLAVDDATWVNSRIRSISGHSGKFP